MSRRNMKLGPHTICSIRKTLTLPDSEAVQALEVNEAYPSAVMSVPLDVPTRPSGPFSNSPIRSPQGSPGRFFHVPSPIITKRCRTFSTSEKAASNPTELGKVKYFCREKGHGFITPDTGGPDIFVHISDIEGEYVPRPGDEVSYKLCPIPPKNERFQAVHVNIVHLAEGTHERWDSPSSQCHH